ncbi:MAG: response regulator [Phycisphaerae bacterium]
MPRKVRTLICQRSAEDRGQLVQALSSLGEADFDFIETDSGSAAVEQYDPKSIDFALIDRFLGPVNGIDVTRLIRSRHGQDVPVIMVSSEASRDALVEAVEVLSVNGYLLKPLDTERLKSTVSALIATLPDRADIDAPAQADTPTQDAQPEAQPTAAGAAETADSASPCEGGKEGAACSAPHSEVVIESIIEIFTTTCSVSVEPSRCDNQHGCSGPVIIGVIGVFGDLKWSIKLGLPQATAEALIEKFAGFPVPFEDDDMADAVGEMANVFVGHVKRLLDAKGIKVEISLPAVMRAEEIEVLNQGVTCELRNCFATEVGRFWTCLTVDSAG